MPVNANTTSKRNRMKDGLFVTLLLRVSEKRAFLFLLELCQISTNFNNFWYKNGKMTEIVRYIYTFHLN